MAPPWSTSWFAKGQQGFGRQLLAVIVFNLIMFVLAELPLLGYSFAPEQTQDRVERLNAWLGRHARQIVIIVATTIGLYLVARGVAGVV